MEPITWASLGKTLIDIGVGKGVDKLLYLINSLNEQDEQLTSLNALVQAPYHAGMRHLSSAPLRKDPTQQREDIQRAKDKFIDAIGNQVTLQDYLLIAKIESEIGMCWQMLDEPFLSVEAYIRSYVATLHSLYKIGKEWDRDVLRKMGTGIFWSGMIGGVVFFALFPPLLIVGPAVGLAGAYLAGDREDKMKREIYQAMQLNVSMRQILEARNQDINMYTEKALSSFGSDEAIARRILKDLNLPG